MAAAAPFEKAQRGRQNAPLGFLISFFDLSTYGGFFLGGAPGLFSGNFLPSLHFFELFIYSFDALGPRGGPSFSAPAEKEAKEQAQGGPSPP